MRIPLMCAALVASGVAVAAPQAAIADDSQLTANNSKGCYVPERVAHRLGGGVYNPADPKKSTPYTYENSWKAYESSLAAGVKIFETDIRWSSDGVPVLMHDATVDRTTNGTGEVAKMTIAELDALELDNGAGKIPHFKEFLERAKSDGVTVWPEYKPEEFNQAWIDDYAKLIKESGVDAVVPSFLKTELAQFKTLLPEYKQIWFQDVIKSGFALKPSDVPEGAYAGLINASVRFGDNMKSLDKAGIEVYAWFNEKLPDEGPNGWAEVAAYKPKGTITDYPAEYEAWGDSTGYCLQQKVKCAKFPKKLPANATTVLLNKTCKTDKGVKVVTKVSGNGKLVKGKKGKVSVKAGAKGKVKVAYSAKAKGDYPAWKKSKAIKIK